ncbi:hypothetical protein FRB96_007566 [Tulasnella sp. 330]|nr:hypothetical protein FRB96_007566 [Tulasnella sp. 330]
MMSGDDLRRDVKVNKVLTLIAQDDEPTEDPSGAAAIGKPREQDISPDLESQSPTTSSATFVKCLKEILSCEVCLMLYYEPMTLVCGHTFCARCLQRTFDQSPNCPICRHEVGLEVRARLHLLDLRDREVPTNKVLLGIILLAFPKEYMERRQALKDESAAAHAGPCSLPVFLNQMALPGHMMRVNFDEGRHRLMLRRIMSTSEPRFGLMLVPRYSLHGDTNQGYGTMMQIQSVQLLPDNRSICEVQAIGRFRVLQTRGVDGYIVAKVQTVEDIDLAETNTLSERHTVSSFEDNSPLVGSSTLPGPSSRAAYHLSIPTFTLSEPSPPSSRLMLPQQSSSATAAAASSSSSPSPSHPFISSTSYTLASSSTLPISLSTPASPPPPIPDDFSDMLQVCTHFVDQLRNDAAPWIVQRLNTNYGDEPPKEDLVAWCWWLASLLPIDDHEKAKLLPIRSPELRLRLICHWIQKLNDQWWYSKSLTRELT